MQQVHEASGPAFVVTEQETIAMQISRQKAAEIEAALQRLADINHDMSGVIAGAADSRSHTLARHKDILLDLTQVRMATRPATSSRLD